MYYREYKPAEPLLPYIKCIWLLDSSVHSSRERILPDGCIELIFNYGDSYTQHIGDVAFRQPSSFVHGQLKHFIEISPSGATGILGVRFQPFGLSAFIPYSIDVFTQSVVALEDVFGKAGREIEEKLHDGQGDAERVALMNGFLLKLVGERNRTDAVAAAAQLIKTCNGNISTEEAARYACMSERQMERRFREMVGLSPKKYARIARLQYSIHLLSNVGSTTMSQLAYGAGYYDPAHFVRDFTELCGVTPASYFSSVHNMSDLFTDS